MKIAWKKSFISKYSKSFQFFFKVKKFTQLEEGNSGRKFSDFSFWRFWSSDFEKKKEREKRELMWLHKIKIFEKWKKEKSKQNIPHFFSFNWNMKQKSSFSLTSGFLWKNSNYYFPLIISWFLSWKIKFEDFLSIF